MLQYDYPCFFQVVVGLFTKGEEQVKGKQKMKVISHAVFEVQLVDFSHV
jgi:hypothetical protein